MSTHTTYDEQLTRLLDQGHRVTVLDKLDDIDTFDDAMRVGAAAPDTRVGRLVREPEWWTRSD